VKDFCQEAFGLLGLGDPTKAREQLGWEPKVYFKELVKIMVEADIDLAKREAQIAHLSDSPIAP